MLLTIIITLLAMIADAKPKHDKIQSLPGWKGDLPSDMYSGFLSIKGGSHIHYMFAESEAGDSPEESPTVLWMNGGPGFSSLDGFVYENGPFIMQEDNTLKKRKFRWSKRVNMIWLEAPAGVGFSYNDKGDYAYTDERCAHENYLAVQKFFELFPSFNKPKSKFFIIGESYAGVYIPSLAELIVKGTLDGSYKGAKLEGIAVGNGCTGLNRGTCGHGTEGTAYTWKYLMQTPFVPEKVKKNVNKACNWKAAYNNERDAYSGECVDQLNDILDLFSNINTYDVYGECHAHPGCIKTKKGHKTEGKALRGTDALYAEAESAAKIFPDHDLRHEHHRAYEEVAYGDAGEAYGLPSKSHGVHGRVGPHQKPYATTDKKTGKKHVMKVPRMVARECIESKLASAYFNQPEVQRATHVDVATNGLTCWSIDATVEDFKYTKTLQDIPRDIYPLLIKHIGVTIFNGDADVCVPYTDNEAWTAKMGFPVRKEWHPWEYYSNELGSSGRQVGGYATEYDVSGHGKGSFTFLTVKGGRHEVPESSPAQAMEMLWRIVHKKPF